MKTQTSYFKKALVVLMAVMMVFTMMPGMAWAEEAATSGVDGKIAWSLDSDGILTISKAATETDNDGSMNDYSKDSMAPWLQTQQANIKRVVIAEGVTSIGNYAFYKCSNLDSVQFAASVVSIGKSAFAYAKLSEPLVVPGTVKTFGASAFALCTALTDVRLESGERISYGNALFDHCETLKNVTLPSTMTSVPGKMFSYCSAIEELEIPNNISSFGKMKLSPIEGMVSLKKITIPEGIKKTYMCFFLNCSNLRTVEFQGVTEIAANTFMQCTAVRELILPSSLTKYADTTQQMLPKLICFKGTEEQWNTVIPETRRTAWETAGTVVVCNYNATEAGTPATITAQPKSATFAKGSAVEDLTVSVAADADMQLIYSWYMDDGSGYQFVDSKAGNTAAITPEYSKAGTYRYYCEIKSVKDGKVASVTSDVATITVTDAKIPFEKSTTEENTYFIKSATDFDSLSRLVNGGVAFSGITFKMTDDIILSDNWKPIGTTKDGSGIVKGNGNILPFSGTIDGQGHLLTVPKGQRPLLAYVMDANVKNLNIYGEQINGYGLVDEFKGVGLSGNAITIDHVTIKAGTNILKSGFLGTAIDLRINGFAGCSAGFVATIKNSKIEKGVTIGYDGTQSQIGAFAGRFQGTISNCVSEATVKGVDYVGGIVGTRDNAMGLCEVKDCTFKGTVSGSGNYVGGIVGGGYNNQSAPNGIHIDIRNCRSEGTVTGKTNVGGIVGGDGFIAQAWNSYAVVANTFSGKVSGQTNVGGIIGYYESLNKIDNIVGNFYTKNCGAASGIGAVKYVDTNYKNPSKVSETTYFSTEKGTSECPAVENCEWKPNYNRTDDPLGADKEKLTKAVDSIPTEAFAYELVLKPGNVKTEYLVGDAFDFGNAVFAAKMTDGTEKPIDTKDIKVSGYNANSHTVQTVMLTYGYAQMEVQVAVKLDSAVVKKDKLSVEFTLLGDSQGKHDEAEQKGGPHGLAMGGLTTWTSGKYEVDLNATVWDLMQKVQSDNRNITFNARGSQYGTYVYAVTYNNTTLGELDNGKLSGWMYTVNGTHPEVGVGSKFLNDGDTVVFHYTDDYTKEEGSDKWNTPAAGEEVKDVMTSGTSGSAVTSAPTEVKVTEKKNADGTKGTVAEVKVANEHQGEILKQAAEKKSAEIILEVSKADSKGADSVQLSLDVTFVKNVADKTDADLTVNTENGKVTLDQETIKTVLAEAKGATITLEVSKVAKPTEVQKKAAGENGHLLKLTIKSGDRVISDFNKGKVKVVAEIVSKLLDKKVAAIHIADDGKIEQLAGKVLTIGSKKYYEFTTPHFSTFALVDADELGLDVAEEPQTDVKALTAKLTPVARSAKTAKKNVKVTVSLDKQDKAIVKELKDAGYTVKYRFYRSTKKAAGYKAAVTKKTSTYTNTSGKKGTKYYYKVQVRVYDANGKLAAKTALKQCRYAARVWRK